MPRRRFAPRFAPCFLAAVLALACALLCAACDSPRASAPAPAPVKLAAEADLAPYCRDQHGQPRVERVSEHVWVALGHDLANAVMIATPEGRVVVDTGSSLERARAMRQALEQAAGPGPVLAVVLTHSHVDHIAGANVWAGPDTPIWASAEFTPHLLKQYSLFIPAETARGRRQFGLHASPELLPCSALGQRMDPQSMHETGALLPTHTFTGRQTLSFGGVEIRLLEAPGETHDQIVVWVPGDRVLIPADDFYNAFPNLYTLRGTSPRPVEGWIRSLDAMRALGAEHLVPCHTNPLHGRQAIAEALTNYRDAIHWLLMEVVRRANQGQDVETIAHEVSLPPHLAGLPYLQPTYGQLDWSARAIYDNYLGWFDGRPETLYPLAPAEAAAREVGLMGGPERVLELAGQALAQKDPRWALHLLAKLKKSGLAQGEAAGRTTAALAEACQAVALTTANTNGRAYLLETAWELGGGQPEAARHTPRPELVRRIPLEHILALLTRRLDRDKALAAHESLGLVFPDEGRRFTLTVRRGLAQVSEGDPLPGDPAPLAVMTLAAADLRGLVTGQEGVAGLVAKGRISLDGPLTDTLRFWMRFER